MDQSLAELLPRMLLSMSVVIAVMWIAARMLKGRSTSISSPASKKNSTPVDVRVLARQGLGRHASLTVVRTGAKTLVLGVTENNVSVLTELEDIDLDQIQQLQPESQRTGISEDAQLASGQAWTGLLTQIRERTVRRS